MHRLLSVFFVSLLLFLAGCSPFAPAAFAPDLPDLPSEYSLYQQGEPPRAPWWQAFGSSELNRLITLSLTDGFSIRQAWARLDQARATAAKAGASLFPELSLEADISHTRQKYQSSSGGDSVYATTRDYSLGLAGSYELDLWGRIHSSLEAEQLTAEASLEDVHTAFMTLSGQIAENWITLLQVRREQSLIKEQIATNQIYLDVLELRFDKSLSSALDVFQQRAVLAQSKTLLPPLEAQEQVLLHETAVLLGKSPRFDLHLTQDTLPEPLPFPSTGIPADLLANRPDVRAAGLRLQSSEWEIAAARADRLPAITLTAQADYTSDSSSTLFDNWLANLAAGLTGPIFDGNRRSAEVERVRAVARERLALYEETVMQAVRDVENALVNGEKQQAYLDATKKQLALAKTTLQQARERYQNGIVDYLTVLTNLLNVQSLERNLVQRQADLLLYQIALYRTLGGSWYGERVTKGRRTDT